MQFLQFAKCLLLSVLTSYNAATYAGLSVIDVGARAVHTVTYIALSRSGLQLPVSAFLPPPQRFTATDAVLYVAPTAVATWVDSVDVLQEVSKVLNLGYRAVTRAAAVVVEHHELIIHTLARAPPPFLTASQSSYVVVRWSPRNESSLTLPAAVYPNRYRPIPSRFRLSLGFLTSTRPSRNLSAVHDALSPAVFGLPLADRRSPISAVVGLEQCTPYRVLPTRLASTELDMDTDIEPDTSFVLRRERGTSHPDSSKDVGMYEEPAKIIIHVKTCLIALTALCCIVAVGYVILRSVFRAVKWILGQAYRVLASAFGWTVLLAEIMARTDMDICGKLLLLVTAAQVYFASREEYHITGPPPLSAPSPSPIPSSAPAIPSAAAPSKPTTLVDLGESAKVDRTRVPLPDDDDEWAVPQTADLEPEPAVVVTEAPPASLPPTPVSTPPPSPTSFNNPPPPSPSDISSIVPVPQDEGKQLSEPTDGPSVPAPIPGPCNTLVDESTSDNGGDWTEVTRKRQPQRVPAPTPAPAPIPAPETQPSPKSKKTRRGVRGGRGRERAQKQE